MQIKAAGFTPDEIDGFRAAQRQSFSILTEVAATMQEGWSERAAVKLLFEAFADIGVDRFFHVPVALFGARTALPEPWDLFSFVPTRARLTAGTPAIFDASPVIGGVLVDTSYSFCFGDSDLHAELQRHDLGYREFVLASVQRGDSFRDIARSVDRDLTRRGLTNCHRLHPEAVLGHRVLLLDNDDSPRPVDGFHPEVLAWFRTEIEAGRSEPPRTPTWNDTDGSDHAPTAGLWAVEPHIARDGVGVKWEELLVVDADGGARWLDDAAPHLTRH